MKVLTNIRFAQTAGIAQVVFGFMDFIEKSEENNITVTAVNIMNQKKEAYRKKCGERTTTITAGVKVPNIVDIVNKARTLGQVEKKFEKIIKIYQKAIQEEKPDVVLVNGTYFMPWCLLIAAQRQGVPAVLHYHGVLTKETQGWKKHQRNLFLQMEKSFDKRGMLYIFPSKITKRIVEQDVFCRRIRKYVILPNPVSDHFFARKIKRKNKNIGIISRWTRVKNVDFCEKLAEFNHKTGAKFVVNIITDLDKENKKYRKLSKFVKFHKPTSNKKLASFYRNMGVVISPSHFETYGNVAKEALASGTPAIVNPNMGVAETFRGLGLNDWVVDFDSVKSVYTKIETVIGQTVEENVKKEMKKLYMPNKIFNEIISILNNAKSVA